jgi:hypothetical protein
VKRALRAREGSVAWEIKEGERRPGRPLGALRYVLRCSVRAPDRRSTGRRLASRLPRWLGRCPLKDSLNGLGIASELGADGAVCLAGLAHSPHTRKRGLLRGVWHEAVVLHVITERPLAAVLDCTAAAL